MILVLLGTQPFPFARLISELTLLKEAGQLGKEKVIIQSGSTPIEHQDFEFQPFIQHQELDQLIEQADLVVTHGGAGSIFEALQKQKKVIALARLQRFNEHVDDHQEELVGQLMQDKHIIGCKTLAESFALLTDYEFAPYHSSQEKIINLIQGWINEK